MWVRVDVGQSSTADEGGRPAADVPLDGLPLGLVVLADVVETPENVDVARVQQTCASNFGRTATSRPLSVVRTALST